MEWENIIGKKLNSDKMNLINYCQTQMKNRNINQFKSGLRIYLPLCLKKNEKILFEMKYRFLGLICQKADILKGYREGYGYLYPFYFIIGFQMMMNSSLHHLMA
jgi:hypothetical protein